MSDGRPGGARGEAVRTTVDVRYAETDRQGIVYHANFFVWMEIGRTTLLASLGIPYERLEERGLLFSVLDARCRWSGAARFGERVEIATRVVELRSRTVRFGYEIAIGERRIAEGETTLVALDEERRPRRIPDDVAALLSAGAGRP